MPRRGKRKSREPSRAPCLSIAGRSRKHKRHARTSPGRSKESSENCLRSLSCFGNLFSSFPLEHLPSCGEQQHWHSIAVAGKLHEPCKECKASYISISGVPNSVASLRTSTCLAKSFIS